MKQYNYYVYILASDSGTLYVWVTNNLERRIQEHKQWVFEGFSKKYGCHKLIHIEHISDVNIAIQREKQIKKWNREKKEFLIRQENPNWIDLSEKWFES